MTNSKQNLTADRAGACNAMGEQGTVIIVLMFSARSRGYLPIISASVLLGNIVLSITDVEWPYSPNSRFAGHTVKNFTKTRTGQCRLFIMHLDQCSSYTGRDACTMELHQPVLGVLELHWPRCM